MITKTVRMLVALIVLTSPAQATLPAQTSTCTFRYVTNTTINGHVRNLDSNHAPTRAAAHNALTGLLANVAYADQAALALTRAIETMVPQTFCQLGLEGNRRAQALLDLRHLNWVTIVGDTLQAAKRHAVVTRALAIIRGVRRLADAHPDLADILEEYEPRDIPRLRSIYLTMLKQLAVPIVGTPAITEVFSGNVRVAGVLFRLTFGLSAAELNYSGNPPAAWTNVQVPLALNPQQRARLHLATLPQIRFALDRAWHEEAHEEIDSSWMWASTRAIWQMTRDPFLAFAATFVAALPSRAADFAIACREVWSANELDVDNRIPFPFEEDAP